MLTQQKIRRCLPILGLLFLGSILSCTSQPMRVLVEIWPEDAGQHCGMGGERIVRGRDHNLDGVLSEGEVFSVVFDCDASVRDAAAAQSDQNQCDLLSDDVGYWVSCHDGTEIPIDEDDFIEHGVFDAVVAQEEPSGSNCSFGGYRLDMGNDSDADGELDLEEVEQSIYFCHGTPGMDGIDGTDGLNSLVDFVALAPGDFICAHGGQKVMTGLDHNLDGVLGADEVSQITFVCHGEPGEDGINCTVADGEYDSQIISCSDGTEVVIHDGVNALIYIVLEPIGTHCLYGGQKVLTGYDLNFNAVLDSGEMDTSLTSYVCDGAPGNDGVDGDSALVELVDFTLYEPCEDEVLQGDCALGGLVLRAGLDDGALGLAVADDGVLQCAEILHVDVVCHGAQGLQGIQGHTGAPGANSVMEVLSGAECVDGYSQYGYTIRVGLDYEGDDCPVGDMIYACGDGVIDIEQSTHAICPPELSALDVDVAVQLTDVQLMDEAYWGACEYGRLLVRTGFDDEDINGVLDEDEIEGSFTTCNLQAWFSLQGGTCTSNGVEVGGDGEGICGEEDNIVPVLIPGELLEVVIPAYDPDGIINVQVQVPSTLNYISEVFSEDDLLIEVLPLEEQIIVRWQIPTVEEFCSFEYSNPTAPGADDPFDVAFTTSFFLRIYDNWGVQGLSVETSSPWYGWSEAFLQDLGDNPCNL